MAGTGRRGVASAAPCRRPRSRAAPNRERPRRRVPVRPAGVWWPAPGAAVGRPARRSLPAGAPQRPPAVCGSTAARRRLDGGGEGRQLGNFRSRRNVTSFATAVATPSAAAVAATRAAAATAVGAAPVRLPVWGGRLAGGGAAVFGGTPHLPDRCRPRKGRAEAAAAAAPHRRTTVGPPWPTGRCAAGAPARVAIPTRAARARRAVRRAQRGRAGGRARRAGTRSSARSRHGRLCAPASGTPRGRSPPAGHCAGARRSNGGPPRLRGTARAAGRGAAGHPRRGRVGAAGAAGRGPAPPRPAGGTNRRARAARGRRPRRPRAGGVPPVGVGVPPPAHPRGVPHAPPAAAAAAARAARPAPTGGPPASGGGASGGGAPARPAATAPVERRGAAATRPNDAQPVGRVLLLPCDIPDRGGDATGDTPPGGRMAACRRRLWQGGGRPSGPRLSPGVACHPLGGGPMIVAAYCAVEPTPCTACIHSGLDGAVRGRTDGRPAHRPRSL